MTVLDAITFAMESGMGVRFEAYAKTGPNGEPMYGMVVYPAWVPNGKGTSFQSTFGGEHDDEAIAAGIHGNVNTITILMREKGMSRPSGIPPDEVEQTDHDWKKADHDKHSRGKL